MKRRQASIISIVFLLIIIPLVFSGCSKNKKQPSPQQQSAQSQNQSDKAPDQLKNIEDNIEKIFETLGGPTAAEEKKGEDNKSIKPEEEGRKEDDQGKEDGQKKEQSSASPSSPSPSPSPSASPSPKANQAAQKEPWTDILSTAHNLHYQWNEYMPSAVTKGASRTLTDNFSNALNALTNAILAKDKPATLMSSNALYQYIPDFYQLYKTKTSPEIKRVRYYARNSVLDSETANWTQAGSDMESLKSSWSMYRNTVTPEQRDNVNKLEYSILEMEKVIKEKNQPLTEIKGRVVLANAKALEKAAEKQEK